MGEIMPKFNKPICRGSYMLGTACGHCEKCSWERSVIAANPPEQPKQSDVSDLVERIRKIHSKAVGACEATARDRIEHRIQLNVLECSTLLDAILHIQALQQRVEALDTAISWIEPPFVDKTTSEKELRQRIMLCIQDKDRAVAKAED